MPNPIMYENLVHGNVEEGFKGLLKQIGEVRDGITKMLQDVKKEAEGFNVALSATSTATKEDKEAIAQYSAQVGKLHAENEKLTKSLDYLQKQIDALKKKKNDDNSDTDKLAKSYDTLSSLIAKTGVNLNELLQTEKQKNIASKNGETANKALAGSYNQLYAQYNLVKNVLNAMGKEMRNNTNIGKVWEAEALRIMNTMKGMQEATGKHTLSVGDYSKALNGLSISTQQVLREMPTLANSLQQFFIAISNNVPIFMDNLKAVKEETGSWKIAMKGVLTSLFSWQTALLVLLTILPDIARKIREKKKAQDEDNKSLKKQIEYHNLLREALVASLKSETENISKLRTLVKITQDVNRGQEDRIKAAQLLKKEYKDQLSNYSAEEIALGKAKVSLDRITESLQKQARARALLNKITEAYSKQIDAEDAAITAGQTRVSEYGLASVKGLYDYIQEKVRTTNLSEEQIRKSIALVEKGSSKIWEQYDAYKEAKRQIAEYGKTIETLTKRLPVSGLESIADATKNAIDKQKDYFYTWAESIGNIIEGEELREIYLSNLSYEKKKENLQKELDEQKKAGTLTAQNESYITSILLNLETERQQKVLEIRNKYAEQWRKDSQKYTEVVAEESINEPSLAVSSLFDRLLAENANKLLESRAKLNDALENGTYREAKNEGEIFKNLTTEKLRLEAELQKALLKMRLDTGSITQNQYDIQLAEIENKLAKSISGLASKRRRKFSIWNLLVGKTTEDGKGNVFKELTPEMENYTKAIEQSFSLAIGYMNDWIDKRIEMAEVAIEAAQKESEAAKSALEAEQIARANGYANNVEIARKEYEEKLAIEKKATEEKERLQRVQEAVNTAQQFSSLLTATANIWSAEGLKGILGVPLAIAATSAMWASFAAAKITAAQATKYGDGMTEYLDYGGSHASGNDIDFGMDRNGKRRRVERGEVIGVVNKKNVDKYGADKVMGIITSLNNGTFDNLYGNTFYEKYGLAFNGMGSEGTNLSMVEKGIATLVEQGETKIVSTPNGRIEYRGNNKRIIRNS